MDVIQHATKTQSAIVVQSLDKLLAAPGIGQASKLAYLWIWEQAGKHVREDVAISQIQLAAALGRTERAARHWLDDLARHGLIWVWERLPGGIVILDVHAPFPERETGARRARAKHDAGQKMLPLDRPHDHTGNLAAESATKTAASLPSDPPGEPLSLRAAFMAACHADAPPPEPPPAGAGAITKYQETKISSTKLPSPNQDQVSTLDPQPIRSATTELALTVLAVGDVDRQRSKVEAWVLTAVPELRVAVEMSDGVSIDGRHAARDAARLIVDHDVPERDLKIILNDVRAMRAAGTLRNPGGFLRAKVTQLARRYGVNLRAKFPNGRFRQRE